jgi:hypothetical protein
LGYSILKFIPLDGGQTIEENGAQSGILLIYSAETAFPSKRSASMKKHGTISDGRAFTKYRIVSYLQLSIRAV